ncbi:2-amino-4-hydroxy-6-hydroxymethyldihydropteridine diphosphokinase [Pseudomonadota bacterium]
MITAYIGLGSNLLEPLRQLRRAVQAIAALPQSQLGRVSTAYRSRAVGPGEQPDYLNAVLQLDTALAAPQLLAAMQTIERAQGRVRTVRWGPRSLDLDILLYGNTHMDSPALSIPHPAMRQRNFVLYPLAAISGPQLRLPDGEDLATLLARCPRGDLVDTGLRLTH